MANKLTIFVNNTWGKYIFMRMSKLDYVWMTPVRGEENVMAFQKVERYKEVPTGGYLHVLEIRNTKINGPEYWSFKYVPGTNSMDSAPMIDKEYKACKDAGRYLKWRCKHGL